MNNILGKLIGEFKGTITGVRILPEGRTEMSIHGIGMILGLEATYASTGVFNHAPNGILIEEGNGLITTAEHDVAIVRYSRISVSVGKGRKASFREASYYSANSEKLAALSRIIGLTEFETEENGSWTLKIWEWK